MKKLSTALLLSGSLLWCDQTNSQKTVVDDKYIDNQPPESLVISYKDEKYYREEYDLMGQEDKEILKDRFNTLTQINQIPKNIIDIIQCQREIIPYKNLSTNISIEFKWRISEEEKNKYREFLENELMKYDQSIFQQKLTIIIDANFSKPSIYGTKDSNTVWLFSGMSNGKHFIRINSNHLSVEMIHHEIFHYLDFIEDGDLGIDGFVNINKNYRNEWYNRYISEYWTINSEEDWATMYEVMVGNPMRYGRYLNKSEAMIEKTELIVWRILDKNELEKWNIVFTTKRKETPYFKVSYNISWNMINTMIRTQLRVENCVAQKEEK